MDANDADGDKELADAIEALSADPPRDDWRALALQMWARVLENPGSSGSQYWVQEVARKLLEADRQPDAKRRPDAILKAVGLAGRYDRWHALREDLAVFRSFSVLDGETERRGKVTKAEIAMLRHRGHFSGPDADAWDDQRIRKLIEEQAKKMST